MYFDRLIDKWEGTLKDVGESKDYSNMYHLVFDEDSIIRNQNPIEEASRFKYELAIQKDRPLGQKLQQKEKELLLCIDKTILVEPVLNDNNEVQVIKFFSRELINEKEGDSYKNITIAILSVSDEWTIEEEEELEKYYRSGYLPQKLAILFGRDNNEKEVEAKIKQLYSRVSRTPIEPTRIVSCFPDGIFPSFEEYSCDSIVLGAVWKGEDRNMPYGGVMRKKADSEELSFEQEESLFDVVFTSFKDTIKGSLRTDTLFKVTGNTVEGCSPGEIKTIKDTIGAGFYELESEEIDKLKNKPFFLNQCKGRLSLSDTDSFYVWFRLEDIEKDDNGNNANCYFYGACTDLSYLLKMTEPAPTVCFLRYTMALKSEPLKSAVLELNTEKEKAQRSAVKSAISAIMTRNMSHNLGSHVLYYTQRDLLDAAAEKQFDESVMMCLRGASFISSFIKNRTNYIAAVSEDSKLPSLPVSFKQGIFDILTVDEDTKAPRINYYLKNIVRSEGFSRDRDNPKDKSSLRLILNIDDLTERLESISVALPGGVLSAHAFFNIFENFIRNSAKYWSSHSQRDKLDVLEFTIKLTINEQRQLQVIIYDNKGEAESIITKLQGSINNIRFLNYRDNSIDKENKGIKEMILSYLWLQSNTFEDSLSSIIYRIDKREEEAINILNQIKYVAVNNKGQVAKNTSSLKGLNLGLCFKLPLHFPEVEITDENAKSLSYGFSADIITTTKKIAKAYNLSGIFSRLFLRDNQYEWSIDKTTVIESDPEAETQTQHLFASICDHFKTNVDQFRLCFGDYNEGTDDKNKLIFIKHHLNNNRLKKGEFLSYYNNYLYVDSESGANYTRLLSDLLHSALIRDGFCNTRQTKTWKDKYIALKIKESALTRITIIDERLFLEVRQWIDLDEMSDRVDFKGSQLEYSLKNIRVLNWARQQEDGSIKVFNGESFKAADGNIKRVEQNKTEQFPCFCGNEFRSVGPYGDCPNKTHFISIHLGIIQKIFNESPSFADDVRRFMEYIKLIFQPDFICVHSGRGGLSSEMENTVLSDYPLIPFVALESAFNDSKFLLAQLFYSLKYKKTIGGSHDKKVKK